MSTPERDPKDIFAEALRLTNPAERTAYLARACAGDPALHKNIESLLHAHERAGQFLQPTVLLPEAGVALERPGTMIGRYKLLEQIGEGGFGVVYMAEQTEPVQRKVALKIIKPGMDTRQVVARFEAERQALALMDHPNIAKVLDAGATEAGRPYFVMELVRGIPITDYCDQKALSTTERLRLFIQVCHAVQHAHQKGIIHRDLKPSNVMVTLHDGEPVPKVIDFGVAKALGQKLTAKTLFTSFAQMLGTPAYMSPEQAELSGLDIDTRSDVYSLGVLLYELLTGVTPFDKETLAKAALDEVRRILRETEPPKPSTRLQTLGNKLEDVAKHRQAEPTALSRLVRGDLDWIVMKCLEKDRTRRYETADGLALDIERHLDSEPVLARPPTAAYQLMKFARRHQAGLAVASAIVGLLSVGVVVSTWLAVRAIRAEARQSTLLKQKEEALLEAERQRRQAKENEDRALNLLYAIEMQAVQQAIGNGLLDQARALLNNHLPRPVQRDRRGFEWFYYAHLAKGQNAAVLLEQTNRFTGLAAAQDGNMLALLDPDEIKAFDLSRQKVVQRWPRVHQRVLRISIAPDGQWIALGTTNDLVLLNTATGQTNALAAGRANVISFAPDRPWIALGSWIALPPTREGQHMGDEGRVRIWDYEQRRLLHSLPDATGPLLWWETNSTVLAGVNNTGTLQRWDAVTGTRIQTLTLTPSRQGSSHYAGAIAAQGIRGVLALPPDKIGVFDPADGQILSETPWFSGLTPLTPVALSADGQFVASGELASIHLAETDDLQTCQRLEGHLKDVRGIAFIGASSNLVSCGEDGRLLLWERKPPFAIAFTPDTNWMSFLDQELVLSADQRFCAVNGKIWSLPGGDPVRSHPGAFLGFSPTSEDYVTASDGELRVWRFAESATNSSRVFPRPANWTEEHSFQMRLSPDGRYLACNDGFTNILVFQARTGHLLASAARHPLAASFEAQEVHGVQFLPTSHRLLVEMGHGGVIWDWQAPTNSPLTPLPGEPYGVSWDGRWIALRDESGRRLKLVGTEASQKVRIELQGHGDQISAVAFSHDGQTLASVDARHELRLWKLPEGRLVGVMQVAAGLLRNLTFAPDDQRLYIPGNLGVEVLEAPRPSQSMNQPPLARPQVVALPPDSIWAP
jgi:eukaryotic-like serine/threonine-protein kinase